MITILGVIFGAIAIVAFISLIVCFFYAIKLSINISRAEEQRHKCNECKHFMTCESPKQYFFAVTGTKCEEFEKQ